MSVPVQRVYQEAASEAVEAAYFDHGQNRLLVQMGTGCGKTTWFAALLQRPKIAAWLSSLPQRGARMLVIAHRDELLTQARAQIQAVNPGLMVSIEQGDLSANRYSDVVVASIQSLSALKYRRLKRLLAYHSFPLVVCDEVHHGASPTYRTTFALLGFLPMADATDKDNVEVATHDDVAEMQKALAGWDAVSPKDRLLVGVTATPNRSDAIGLSCVVQTIAFSYPLKRAIEDGWLVPIVPWVVETTDSLDKVRTTAGDFNQKDLADAVNNPQRNRLAVEAWRTHADGLSTLAFTVDVAHAHALAETFRAAGVPAEAVSGKTPQDERRAILKRFAEGSVEVITNCAVFVEGVDLPRTGCVLMAKPTKSATLYEQMVGRALRTFPGKAQAIIIDLVDVAKRHTLQAAPVLYGLPPGLVTKGKDLRKVAEDLDALRVQYPEFDVEGALEHGRMTLEQLGARATTFDVWTVPTMGDLANIVSLEWIRTAADTFRLQYPWLDGTETLAVVPDLLGHFDVSLTLRPLSGALRQRTIAAQVASAADALKLAEAFVSAERTSVMKLKEVDAPWKKRPASIKQIQMLQRLRIPHNPRGLTMGRASQLIDLQKARA